MAGVMTCVVVAMAGVVVGVVVGVAAATATAMVVVIAVAAAMKRKLLLWLMRCALSTEETCHNIQFLRQAAVRQANGEKALVHSTC